MATKSRARQVRNGLRNFDDLQYIITGKRLRNLAGRTVNIFGEEIAKKVTSWFVGTGEPDLPLDNPYTILGIRPSARDVVVKGAYRALAREYHPDTGTKPDTVKLQAATEAYNAIMAERQERREK